MWFKVDVGGVCFQDDVVDMKTSSLRQPHACVSDKGDKPSGLIIRCFTVLLYASDALKRYGFSSLVVLKVREIDSREGVPAV